MIGGTYRVSAKAVTGDSPSAVSYAPLAQNAYAVEAEVTVAKRGGVLVGILCLVESAGTWKDGGFGFFIGAD